MTIDDGSFVHPQAVPGWWLDHYLGEVARAAMYAARRAVALEAGEVPEYATVMVTRDDDHARLAFDLLGPAAVAYDAVRVDLGAGVALALVLPATVVPPRGPATAPPCVARPTPVARPTVSPFARQHDVGFRQARDGSGRRTMGRRVAAAVAIALLLVTGGRTLRSPRADATEPAVEVEAWDPTTATATVRHGDRVETYVLGAPGDQLVLGDWDGDGVRTPALYRASTGEVWAFDRWAGDEEGADARALGTHPAGGTPRVARANGRETVVVDPPEH